MNKDIDVYEYLVKTANLISNSYFGNKMILKGGSVLISRMIENNRIDLYRRTHDLDIHCDKREVWIKFYTEIESILNNNNFGYVYKIVDRRSLKKEFVNSDSLRFELYDSNRNIKAGFKIDMNIKSNTIITCEYSPILNMNTYDALTMLSDKIVTVSSQKIFRRIRDLYDLCVILEIYDIFYYDIMEHLRVKHGNVNLQYMLTEENWNLLKHAYLKYDAIKTRPELLELVSLANSFLYPIYNSKDFNTNMIWYHGGASWDSL